MAFPIIANPSESCPVRSGINASDLLHFVAMDPLSGTAECKNREALHGCVAICKIGTVSCAEKTRVAVEVGAVALLIICNEGSVSSAADDRINQTDFPVAFVKNTDGSAMLNICQASSSGARGRILALSHNSIQNYLVDAFEAAGHIHSKEQIFSVLDKFSECILKPIPFACAPYVKRMNALMRRAAPSPSIVAQGLTFPEFQDLVFRRPWCQLFSLPSRKIKWDLADQEPKIRMVCLALQSSNASPNVVTGMTLSSSSTSEFIREKAASLFNLQQATALALDRKLVLMDPPTGAPVL